MGGAPPRGPPGAGGPPGYDGMPRPGFGAPPGPAPPFLGHMPPQQPVSIVVHLCLFLSHSVLPYSVLKARKGWQNAYSLHR